MDHSQNPFRTLRVEFHILQSFPVTCLNRDDVGAPKTAVVGGVLRARVSSQCWKRQVRLSLREFGVNLGSRTKLIAAFIEAACLKEGATEAQAKACGSRVEQVFIKKSDADAKGKKDSDSNDPDQDPAAEKTDTLLFLSENETRILAQKFKEVGFVPEAVITQKDSKKQAKEIEALIGKPEYAMDGLDIALFGRMVAQAAKLNVEAAASFSHAISTHKVTNEVEFFTALDDRQEDTGSAHMGSLEFNSATYYRYVRLDLGQLWETLAGQGIPEALEAFVKALYVAVPSARQTTQSGASPWEFAKILVRHGQPLQVPFETAISAKNGGYLQPSIEGLKDYLAKKEKLSGSLFGKVADYTYGEDENFSIDALITALKNSLPKA